LSILPTPLETELFHFYFFLPVTDNIMRVVELFSALARAADIDMSEAKKSYSQMIHIFPRSPFMCSTLGSKQIKRGITICGENCGTEGRWGEPKKEFSYPRLDNPQTRQRHRHRADAKLRNQRCPVASRRPFAPS
jgi:hypothetical protein